jgi:hypothetical protein
MAAKKLKGEVPGGRSRVYEYILSQPAILCFLISLFLITIALAALGVYVRGKDRVPDLDAMKVSN